MACFEDAEGIKWKVSPDGAIVSDWKEECGVNVFELLDDRCKLMTKVVQDPFAQMELLWVACRDQAAACGVASRREFAKRLSGEVLLSAINALWEGIRDFFPQQETRELFGAILEKGKQTAQILMTTQLTMARAVDPNKVASTLRDTITNSAASVEETPTS